MPEKKFISLDDLAIFKEESDGVYIKLPELPSTDGVYKLTLTITGGAAEYSWVEETPL